MLFAIHCGLFVFFHTVLLFNTRSFLRLALNISFESQEGQAEWYFFSTELLKIPDIPQ
jgi:hypothetical protein